MATQYANGKIVTDGLVLNLNAADRNSYPGSGTTWFDTSGLSNNGTLTNGPTFSSSNGGIFSFDGTDDYVNIPYNTTYFPSGANARTMTVWFKSTRGSYPSVGDEIFSVGGNLGNGTRIGVWIDTANQGVGIEMVNCARLFTSWSGLNTWVNICAVVPQGATLTSDVLVYYNGVAGGTYYGSAYTLNTSTTAAILGTVADAVGAHNFVGQISSATIYNRALSATEILQNYNAQKTRFGLK
jgi:hypothetical protein